MPCRQPAVGEVWEAKDPAYFDVVVKDISSVRVRHACTNDPTRGHVWEPVHIFLGRYTLKAPSLWDRLDTVV